MPLSSCTLNLNACENQNQSNLLLGERAGVQLHLAANLYACISAGAPVCVCVCAQMCVLAVVSSGV